MKIGPITSVCAVIGLIAGGFYGLLIGIAIGLYFEYQQTNKDYDDDLSGRRRDSYVNNQRPHSESVFNQSLLTLIAAVMNADGSVMKSELSLVKAMFVRTYGEQRASFMLLELRELLKSKQDITRVCANLRQNISYTQRLELLHVLFRISRADGDISQPELNVLQMIAAQLGITTPDFLAIRAMFVVTPGGEYQILEVEPNASEEEVKKAYRKMAMRFHPDRLTGVSNEEKKAAEEKFRKVQQAYETIKKRRGWN